MPKHRVESSSSSSSSSESADREDSSNDKPRQRKRIVRNDEVAKPEAAKKRPAVDSVEEEGASDFDKKLAEKIA